MLLQKDLKMFGLNDNESKVYVALLSLGEAKASELAHISTVPRSKIYEVTHGLHKKGFIEIIPEKVTRFRVVPFNSVLKMFLEDNEKRIRDIVDSGERICNYLKKNNGMKKRYENGIGEFTVYRSKKMVYRKMNDILYSAKKNVLLIIDPKEMKRLINIGKHLSKSGIDIRILSQIDISNRNVTKKWLKVADVRHHEILPTKIAIIDDAEAFIFQSSSPVALHSKDPSFVALMNNFGKSAWEESIQSEDILHSIETGSPIKRTFIVRGDNFSVITTALKRAKKDVVLCVSDYGLRNAIKKRKNLLEELKSRGVRVRYITRINKNNMKIIEDLCKYAEVRHSDIRLIFAQTDNEFLIPSKSDTKDEEIIISNVQEICRKMKELIENIWESSIPAKDVIKKFRVGERLEETKVVRGPKDILDTGTEMAKRAKKEIVFGADEHSLKIVEQNYKTFLDAKKNGVKIRILCPITKGNIHLAKKYKDLAEIMHAKIPFGGFITDRSELLITSQRLDPFPIESIYSNNETIVKSVSKILENIWNMSVPVSEKIKELETGKPAEVTKYIKGRKNLYSVLSDILKNTKQNLVFIATANGMLRLFGSFEEEFKNIIKSGARVRCITSINEKNIHIAKMFPSMIRHMEGIHAAFACIDDWLIIHHVKNDNLDIDSPEDSTIITNQKKTVEMVQQMLESMWEDAMDASLRIKEIETGSDIEETIIVRGINNTNAKSNDLSREAEKEICIMTTEKRIMNYPSFEVEKKVAGRGVKIRYILPITMKNIDIIKKIMKYAEVRHTNFIPARVKIKDDNSCFIRHGTEDESDYDWLLFSVERCFVKSIKKYFEKLWEDSMPADNRIKDIAKDSSLKDMIDDIMTTKKIVR